MRIFFYVLIHLLVLPAFSQSTPTLIHAKSLSATIIVESNGSISKSRWTISPATRPDIFSVSVRKSKKVSFITDRDSMIITVKPGQVYDFIVLVNGKDSAYTRIETNSNPEPAEFSARYKRRHYNKTTVEIPRVYEMMHVIFALTKSAGTDIAKNTGYYKNVTEWFEEYKAHPTILMIDSLITSNRNYFFNFKKDAYAFEMNRKGRIIRSAVYDRIASNGGFPQNTLLPYIPELQQFSDDTAFPEFYKRNQNIYNQQVSYYEDSAGIAKMLAWLNRNFPSTQYHSFKIIFSPLVRGNQSSAWFSNNWFNEAQAHINFPYSNWTQGFTGQAAAIKAGNIAFTELNHAFINPEADKEIYINDITTVCKDLPKWIDLKKEARHYNTSYSCFNEYMNWGLVSLRYLEEAPAEDLDNLLKDNTDYMMNGRGFILFGAFSEFLVNLYMHRRSGHVLADLYPEIIKWFKEH